MTVRLADDGTIRLEGECPLEEAEVLLGHLLARTEAIVDWRQCEYAHTAVVQVLLASAAPLLGPPRDAFLREQVEPLLPGSRNPVSPLSSGPRMP